jgi:hypothetical protein
MTDPTIHTLLVHHAEARQAWDVEDVIRRLAPYVRMGTRGAIVINSQGRQVFNPDGSPMTIGDAITALERKRPYLFRPLPQQEEYTMKLEQTIRLEALTDTHRQACDPAARRAKREAWMAPFQPGGQHEFAPEDRVRKYDRDQIEKQVAEIQSTRDELQRAADAARGELPNLLEQGRQLPSDAEEYLRARGQTGLSGEEALLLDIRGRLDEEHYRRRFTGVGPEILRRAYQRADVSVKRFLEDNFDELVRVDPQVPEQVTAAHGVKRLMNQAQEERIPEAVKDYGRVIEAAQVALRRSQDLRDHGVLEVVGDRVR